MELAQLARGLEQVLDKVQAAGVVRALEKTAEIREMAADGDRDNRGLEAVLLQVHQTGKVIHDLDSDGIILV